MEFQNRVSTAAQPEQIASELAQGITGSFDLGILFCSLESKIHIEKIISLLRQQLSIRHFLGCTCAGIIGSQDEIENAFAVSLFVAKLPDVRILPFHMNQIQLEGLKSQQALYDYLEIYPNEHPVFLAFPDPFSIDMGRFLDMINLAYPNRPVIGGLASAASRPQENILILDGDLHDQGLIGIVLSGNVDVETVVSQGCRPIGQTHIVTKAEENVVYQLAGQPFINILKQTFDQLTVREKLLAQEALFLGMAINEYKDNFKRGDFLIRGLMAVDEQTGAGVIGDRIQTGQTVQFHIRDAESATEDLNELLQQQQKNLSFKKPSGALVFSCNGRGQWLFKERNHDIKIIQQHLGPVAAGGFFCAGEIGPVGKKNFLHGFTDSLALFYPKN